jgi:hypothetical protein
MIDDKQRFIALMTRYCEVGHRLPSEDDILYGGDKAQMIATARVVLAEMEQTKREIDKMLGITGDN